MRILSLFDGMACGMLAFQRSGIEVERYVAYEIDKYAIQVSTHNFPGIEHRGDVFKADFTEFEGFDFVIGGSPCTYWSIAQKKSVRETEAHGIGWELFQQYVRGIREAKPKYFIYENNKSMAAAIREEISDTFGFEPICINSALVSAQNRQRLYWVGIRNEDGTYRKADIEQPEDRGILLKDILDGGENLTGTDKSYCLTASYDGAVPWNTLERGQRSMVAVPIAKGLVIGGGTFKDGRKALTSDKGYCLLANPPSDMTPRVIESAPIRVGALPRPNGELSTSQGMRIYSIDGKSITQCASDGGLGARTGLYAVPMRVPEATKKGYVDIEVGDCVDLAQPNSKTRRGRAMVDKSNCLTTSHAMYQYMGEKDQTIYEVKDGVITIKDKRYPIKLVDGSYVIRKLTVTECKRLQTVPDDYDMSVISNTQAYKCLGNGWTVDVIAHLITSTLCDTE